MIVFKVDDLVQIEWEDSYGCSSRWQDINPAGEPQAMLCQSVGWVIRIGKRFVVIVPHIAKNEVMDIRQGCGDMTIPLAAIVNAIRLSGRGASRHATSSFLSLGKDQNQRHS